MKIIYLYIGLELNHEDFYFENLLKIEFGGGVRMIRKKGKLPNNKLVSVKYGLEYGKDELEMAHFTEHELGTCVVCR